MGKPYVYIEYPKCLYQGTETLTVDNEEEEEAANKLGWKTAAEHFEYKKPHKVKGNKEEGPKENKEDAKVS